MSTVINGGTTTDPTLTVRIGLTGTGAMTGNSVQLYRGVTAVGNPVVLSSQNITDTYVDIATPSLIDGSYGFNATIANSVGASAHSVANYTVTVAGGGSTGGATLLFFDDFNTLDLVTPGNPNGVWRPNDFWQNISRGYKDFAGTSWNANPNEASVNLNPFSVAGSVLTITAARIPSDRNAAIAASMAAQGQTGAPSWYGGMLISNANLPVQRYLYGYFEMRARFPTQGSGMFPALWFYNSMGGPKPNAEIDLFEIFGTPNRWTTTLHPGPEVGAASEDTAGWHVYGMDWQPTYLRFYRDGVLKWQATGSNATYFDVPMGIRINYAMDANWFPPANKSSGATPSPMTMEIDYVSVYDIKP